MDDLVQQLARWTEATADGVSPVTADEAVGRSTGRRRPGRQRRHPALVAAVLVLALAVGAVVVRGLDDDPSTSVRTTPPPGSTPHPSDRSAENTEPGRVIEKPFGNGPVPVPRTVPNPTDAELEAAFVKAVACVEGGGLEVLDAGVDFQDDGGVETTMGIRWGPSGLTADEASAYQNRCLGRLYDSLAMARGKAVREGRWPR
jgi:hypothetical protein